MVKLNVPATVGVPEIWIVLIWLLGQCEVEARGERAVLDRGATHGRRGLTDGDGGSVG